MGTSGSSPAQSLALILVGALLALLAQVIVQRLVVPRVEARKRREDRWERDVLALGELLTVEVPETSRKAQLLTGVLQEVNIATRDDPNFTRRRDEVIEKREEEARQATAALKVAVLVRGDWLADRIINHSPSSIVLREFGKRWETYTLLTQGGVILYDHATDRYSRDAFHDIWGKIEVALGLVLDSVKRLATLPHPPRPPGVSARLWSVARRAAATATAIRKVPKSRKGRSQGARQ